MAASSTPGGQAAPAPPVPPSHMPHHVISAPPVPTNGIVGLPYGASSQSFAMESSSSSIAQEPQSQITAGPSHILRQNFLQQRPTQTQNAVKSDPSRASFVYLLPPPDTSNPSFGTTAPNAANSGINASSINESQTNPSTTQEVSTMNNQQTLGQNQPTSNLNSSTFRLPTQLKMTASCMNTPAPQLSSLPESTSNTLEITPTNQQVINISQNPNNEERMVPNKQERVESCLGILGLRGDDQSRSGSRATLASLGSFTLQPPGNSSGVSPGPVMRMESGVSSIAAQFSFVQSGSSSAGVTAISDINSNSNAAQIAVGGSNVLEGREKMKLLIYLHPT